VNLIPAIDLRGGRCVRLLRGEFDKETEYSDDPAAIARSYTGLGVKHLHVVDLDGARGGEQKNQATVREIIDAAAGRSPLAVQLGGGIRCRQTLAAWLGGGVSRCVIGSSAVTDRPTVRRWFREFGPERIVLALDVRIDSTGAARLSTHGWEQTSDVDLWDCVADYLQDGLKHVLCTDVSRDGAMAGPNLQLYQEFVQRFDTIDLQASGGVRGIDDLLALRAAGVAAAITGRALLDGKLSRTEVQSFLQNE
jgi:phosphoribosylformimino-5-aminoimidazole carboxamide ribotide isomerase